LRGIILGHMSSNPLPKGIVVPNHIALIMDGNGRWARSKGLPATKGHEAGAKAVLETIDAARDWGIHTITVWGFSTENWKRSPKEVHKILSLVKQLLARELENAHKDKVRFVHLGRKDRFPSDLRNLIEKVERETK